MRLVALALCALLTGCAAAYEEFNRVCQEADTCVRCLKYDGTVGLLQAGTGSVDGKFVLIDGTVPDNLTVEPQTCAVAIGAGG